MTTNLILFLAVMATIASLVCTRKTDLAELVRRNYLVRFQAGKIKREHTVEDHLSTIEFWTEQLDEVFQHGLYMEPEDIGPYMWTQGRERMAAIVLAVTDMAEFYEVDILAEMEKLVRKREQESLTEKQ